MKLATWPSSFPMRASTEMCPYQGTEGIEVPHKKPRGGELTDEQREENRAMASVRVKVEHRVRRVKGFKIVRENYRLATAFFPTVASVVVGLVHLTRTRP